MVIAHVGAEGQTRYSVAVAFLRERVERFGRAERVAGIGQRPRHVEGGDVHPLLRQRQSRRPPLPVGRARDQRDLACQSGHDDTSVAALRKGKRYSSRSTRSALLSRLVATISPPKTVSVTTWAASRKLASRANSS